MVDTKVKNLIRLSKSCISLEEKELVKKTLDKEFLGMGEEVGLFEKKLSDYFDRKTVCVVNGTAALHLAIQACNIGLDDEVLVQSLTYVSSFQSISATGAKPVACDVNLDTLTINLEDAKKKLTSKTKAIMPVHYAGGVGNLDEIYNFADKNNLRIIEDAAHAFGTSYKNKKIGSLGDIACFSFDGIKNITSGEGGCVVTSDREVLKKIEDSRLLGVEKDTAKRYANSRSWTFDVADQGWRYHMSNIMAAIGIIQFDKKDNLFKKRQEIAKSYDKFFQNYKSIKTLNNNYNEVVPHIYPLIISGLKDRDAFQSFLLDNNIQTGIHYLPNHFLKFYKKNNNHKLENTEKISTKLISIPLHPELNFKEIEYISKTIIKEHSNF